MATRDELRTHLLSNIKAKFKREPVMWDGVQLEVIQPSLRDILDMRNEDDQTAAIVNIIIKWLVVPGTEERVFEEGDRETLLDMPFGEGLIGVNNAIEKLTGVTAADQKEEVGNLDET